MTMTEFEIVRDFQNAANKNKQIMILSQLNNCTTNDILEILANHGAITGIKREKKEEPKVKTARAEPTKWTPELDAELVRLTAEGSSGDEISERMGIKKQAIFDRRSYLKRLNGRAVSYKQSKPKAVKEENEGVTETMTKTVVNAMTDIRDVAKNLADVFEVMGYGLSTFSFDVLSGTISIVAKEKTAEAATSTVSQEKV